MTKNTALALLGLVVTLVSTSLELAQSEPKIVTGKAAAKIFVYDGKPIHPFCLDFPVEGSSRHVTPNVLARCTDLKVAPKSEADGWWSAEYPEEKEEAHVSFGPYNSYGVLAAKGDKFLIGSEYSGGGSGQFTALFWVRFDGKQILDVKDEAGGDRCAGHLDGYRADGAAIRFNQATPAADIIGLTGVKVDDKIAGELGWGYIDCAGEAHYRYDLATEKLELTGLSLVGAEPASDADPNNPRTCFDKLVQQYTKSKKTNLKITELKEFGLKFSAACGKPSTAR